MTPVELVCFHHAGGGSGRESHCDEPRYVDADACVRGLADELDDLLSRPHVLLGHTWALRCRIRLLNTVFRAAGHAGRLVESFGAGCTHS
jgi:hypothetical protein